MAALPPIKVINYRPFIKNGSASSSSLKGFFEVEILTSSGPITFRDFRFIRQDGQTGFITPPQKDYTNKDGEKKYTTLIDLPKSWKDDILAKLLEVLPADHQGPSSPPPMTANPSYDDIPF